IAGCKSFGIWPLSQAAEACFGTSQWPADRPVPQVSIEFDVADAAAVGPAARELEQAGYELLHPPREEPWGQTVARLQSPEGAIVGISYAPVLHDQHLLKGGHRASGRCLDERDQSERQRKRLPARLLGDQSSSMRRVTGWAVLPEAPTASHTALLGAHLAHISTGNAGKARVGAGIQKGLFCRCFLPFRALRYPLIPTLNRLDKAEVTGSSPVSPIVRWL